MKTFKELREDGMAGGVPGPSNIVSGGAVAGTGGKGGEPGVNPKRKRRVVIQPMARRAPPKA